MDVGVLLDNPEVLVALVILLRAGLAWQRSLSYPEFRTVHAAKRATFPTLQRVTPSGLSFVNTKGYRDDAEYLLTVDESVRAVAQRLRAGGGSYHVISSIKRRETPDGPQYSRVHVVWTHEDGQQTECYLFPAVDNGDGRTDVYAHLEASVTDPDDHLDGPQPDGDPRGVVRDALGGSDD
jgi:hypothetical protein